MNIYRKIRKSGNSLSIPIPMKAKDFGFAEKKDVFIKLEKNKIIIIPKKPELFNSRIKGYHIISVNKILPIWSDSSKSIIFEETNRIVKKGENEYEILLYIDHQEDRFLAFFCGKESENKWIGKELTQEQFDNVIKTKKFQY